MAGFEVIVRPMVLPNIRPAPPRILAPEVDPASGIVVLGGAGGRLINLTESESNSRNSSRATETKRTFKKQRIYNKDDSGTVDKSQFVDVETIQKLWTVDGSGKETETTYAEAPTVDNVETLLTNQTRINSTAPTP